MYGEQSMSWFPKICSHELLELFATWQGKSIDVSFTSIWFASYKNFCAPTKHAHSIYVSGVPYFVKVSY